MATLRKGIFQLSFSATSTPVIGGVLHRNWDYSASKTTTFVIQKRERYSDPFCFALSKAGNPNGMLPPDWWNFWHQIPPFDWSCCTKTNDASWIGRSKSDVAVGVRDKLLQRINNVQSIGWKFISWNECQIVAPSCQFIGSGCFFFPFNYVCNEERCTFPSSVWVI